MSAVDQAGRRALASYRGGSATTQAQTRLRWWWCPFPAVAAEVPVDGRVLDVGCGHGLLSLYLALAAPGRRVLGVDIDGGKVAEARHAAGRLGPGQADVSFEQVRAGELASGQWDAIVTADVLYLLPAGGQQRLLGAMAAALAPGGVVVLKESGMTPRWKFRWSRFQETLATRVLPITESTGDGLTFTPPDQLARWLTEAGLDATHRPVDTGYAWPHHLVIGRRGVSP